MGKQWDDARRWKEAQRKADKKNAKTEAEIPLFAEQEPRSTAEAEYWKWRSIHAHIEGAIGHDSNEKIFRKDWQIGVMKRIAAELLDAEQFAFMDGQRWKGDEWYFWRDVITGGRQVIASQERIAYHGPNPVFGRHEDGTRDFSHFITDLHERVELRCTYWPPEGWTPPLTREQLATLLDIPAPTPSHQDAAAEAMLGQLLDGIRQRSA